MCKGKWKYSSRKPHGLNGEKESFPSMQNCDLLSWEGASWCWVSNIPDVSVPRWWRGGGQGHRKPRPGSWGPFSWLRKQHEIPTGSPSRTRLNSRGQSGRKFGMNSGLVTPNEFMKKGNDGRQKWHVRFDQQPTTRLAYWGDVVKEGLADSLIKKKKK